MSRILGLALLLALAACPKPRTSPATAASPKAFDAAGSDPRALEIVDQVIAAHGGDAAWAKAHEILWTEIVVIDGQVRSFVSHGWDRWNGRHHFERLDQRGTMSMVMHDLFDGTGYAEIGSAEGGAVPTTADKKKMIAEAQANWAQSSYRFLLPFKLKDPGVHVKHAEERPDPTTGQPKWDVLRVSFDPGVGPTPGDVYYVVVDRATHLIDIVEIVLAGKNDDQRYAFALEAYADVGGLKLPQVHRTLGYGDPASPPRIPEMSPAWKEMIGELPLPVPSQGQYVIFIDTQIRPEPDDNRYVPPVQ